MQENHRKENTEHRKNQDSRLPFRSPSTMMNSFLPLLVVLCLPYVSHSFISQPPIRSLSFIRGASDDGQDDEIFVLKKSELAQDLDGDLTPPPINLRKESILFGENPTTAVNNNALKLWMTLKERLPFVVTGARENSKGDENPIGAIYNIIFVRLPVICAGLVYGKNLSEGHPLVVDIGEGPFTMSPLAVFAILFVILR